MSEELEPVRFIVSDRPLLVSQWLWRQLEGPKPRDGFACDGCSWSPDAYVTLTGKVYKLWPACVVHDYGYRTHKLRMAALLGTGPGIAGTAAGRKECDGRFRRNLRMLIKLQGGSGFDQKRLAWLYWGRVRIWGAKAFQHWGEGAEPLSFWARVREVW